MTKCWADLNSTSLKISITMRMLTTKTRIKIESIINRLASGKEVSLEERINLHKYAMHIPFLAGKLNQAMRKRDLVE